MDELTSNMQESSASPAPSHDSGEQVRETSVQEAAAQPQQSQSERVNLFEIPEFRNYQAQMNRQIAEMQRRSQETQQELHAARMAQMDDLEKANYTSQQYQQSYEQLLEQNERQQLEWQRWQTLNELSQKTGVPIEQLQGAATPKEAYEIAIAGMMTQTEALANARAAELAQRIEANRPDLGMGSTTDKQTTLRRAIADKDTRSFYKELFSE